MSFNELAVERKSVRGFTSQSIPREYLDQILEAAVQSPSGGNRQPWHFYVITDRDVIRQLYEKAYHAEWFLGAPVVFAVCVDVERSGARYGDRGRTLYSIQDTGAAIQSILLCAKDLGLGTCWCGAFEEEAVSQVLQIPEHLRPIALIPMGYGDSDTPKPRRRPMEEVVTFVDGKNMTQ